MLANTTRHIRRIGIASVAGLAIAATASTALAVGFDMRKCRLDRVVFVDPWTDQQFSVNHVGTAYYFLCGDDWVESAENIGGNCLGPFGSLLLQGMRTDEDGNDAVNVSAIYLTAKAAPCCGWSAQLWDKEQGSAQVKDLKWLEGEEIPTLGATRFGSIDNESGSGPYNTFEGLSNPMIALICKG